MRLVALLGWLLATPALAQAPVTLVVNFAAGGPTDILARLLAPELSGLLGASVVVKNSTGAAGTIGTAEVARARPDGQTLLVSPIGPIAVQPNFMRNPGYRPDDLVPVCQATAASLVMMTPPASGLRTVADVIAQARATPGGMPFASSGMGTLPHLSMVAWIRAAGLSMNHIPYRGAGEVMLAFQQGSVALLSDQPGTARMHDLRALAVFAPARLPDFPDAPTMRELGWELEYTIWQGLFAPAGLPAPLLARWGAACAQALRAPSVVAGLARTQTPLAYRDSDAFAALVVADLAKFRALIEAGGLRQAE